MSLDQSKQYKVLVVPHVHIENIYDLSAEDAAHIFQSTVKIARAVREASGCEGLNLVQSNGRAGQRHPANINIARRNKQNRRTGQTLCLTASFIAELLYPPLLELFTVYYFRFSASAISCFAKA